MKLMTSAASEAPGHSKTRERFELPSTRPSRCAGHLELFLRHGRRLRAVQRAAETSTRRAIGLVGRARRFDCSMERNLRAEVSLAGVICSSCELLRLYAHLAALVPDWRVI